MAKHCRNRAKGLDARGSSKGCDNEKVADKMDAIKTVGNLCAIQASQTSSIVGSVLVAASRLHSSGMIPSKVPQDAVRAVYDALKNLPASQCCKVLFKELWRVSQSDPRLCPYMELIVRVWLITPTETVVESMASTVKAVFGVNRVLDHQNASQELIVRWNGPDVAHADWLIERVLGRNPRLNNFVRSNIAAAVEGTVISRHRASRDPRSYIFRDKTQ